MTADQPPIRRIVLDPNVIISAAISSSGAPGRIIELIDAGTLVPIVCEHLIDEVRDVFTRPTLRTHVDATKAAKAVSELRRLGQWHSDPVDPPQVSRDPDDDYLVALAIAAKADALVSGDQDLHALDDPGVEILTPRELLNRLGER
jgi:putative PIN family toxin of toxin-antitoxin system